MKAWLGEEEEKPISQLCGICGVDDFVSGEMQLEDETEEAIAKDNVIHEGEEAVRFGKESEDRIVRKLIDPKKPTRRRLMSTSYFTCLTGIGALCVLKRRAKS